MIGCSPPTARYARTGLLTPPGKRWAARSRHSKTVVSPITASPPLTEPPHVLARLRINQSHRRIRVGARERLRANEQVVDAEKATIQARSNRNRDGGWRRNVRDGRQVFGPRLQLVPRPGERYSDRRGPWSEAGTDCESYASTLVHACQPARLHDIAACDGELGPGKPGRVREVGRHPASAYDQNGLARQRRFLLEPRHRLLGQVAAGCGAPCAGAAARRDRGLEHSLEPAVQRPRSACPLQRVADLVEDLVLADDRALQAGCDTHQVPHRPLTFVDPAENLDFRHRAKPIYLHPVAGAEEDPLPISGHLVLYCTCQSRPFVRVRPVGLQRHDPWLAGEHLTNHGKT